MSVRASLLGVFSLSLAALLGGCTPGAGSSGGTTAPVGPPQRIVSLDYCADQYVLKFVDRDRIQALSPESGKAFSYMADAAEGLPTVRPRAEDVLLLRPDLVVRAYGGGVGAPALFDRAGIPVLQLGFPNTVEGVKDTTLNIAAGLGAADAGRDVVADLERRLLALADQAGDRSALYMTPGGVTSGPGSLVHDMIEAAGLVNFNTRPGWHPIPLETLARSQPDMVIAAFYDSHRTHPNAWSAARHPIARSQLTDHPVVPLKGAWTACGGWFLIEAIEALATEPPRGEAL